ncbi:unnamed protein product [Moneuplotes crassus]|uniref:Uncharacterized protein n=1 Tax=Euplotes crassus TaxID=5936 RepID=A0AAD1Y8F8_EUPCR|nr:unnamed protein product [Moneuplotes crassus]
MSKNKGGFNANSVVDNQISESGICVYKDSDVLLAFPPFQIYDQWFIFPIRIIAAGTVNIIKIRHHFEKIHKNAD